MNLEDFFSLKNKVAVITGGAGVLCSNIAECLGELGVKVAILDLNEKELRKIDEKFTYKNIKHINIKTDVLDKVDIIEAKDNILKEFGRVDILINGAGGNKIEATTSSDLSFFDMPEEAIKWVFNLNFLGTVLSSQIFGKEIAKQGEGCILNISSMAAIKPLTKTVAYSAAKAAVSNFTQWLSVYISNNYSTNIRVNAIAPGFLLTDQNRYLLQDENGNLTARGKKIIEHTPLQRFGNPDDLLATVIWLLSPGAKFMHGSIIPIDGGFAAFSGV